MSHWRGTWRRKEYETVEKKIIKQTEFYDVNSIKIGKNDEELLRIYYFRNHQEKETKNDITHPIEAKREWQKLVEESKEEKESEPLEIENESNEKSVERKSHSKNNFFGSSSSQLSNLSSFSNKKKFEK